MISRDATFFSRGGCKCTPLQQQELGTVAFRPPLEMHLQGRVTAPPALENEPYFQERVVPSPSPEDAFSGAGEMLQYPAPFEGAGYICTRPWKKMRRPWKSFL